jgi:hypothetical protein
MLLAILAVIFGYRKARDTGRNPFLWAAICGGAFIGTQLIVTFGAGIVLGLGVAFLGWNETLFDDFGWVITLIAIVLSIVVMWLIFKYLDRVPADDPQSTPPPPPIFHEDDRS